MKEKFKLCIMLFVTFFKIGAFTFGGGYAMIPLITSEVVQNKKWIKESDILDIIAIAESTPGPIAVNAATFVGYRIAGFFGAACATIGVVLPSFVIIYAVSFILDKFEECRPVQYAFSGIRAGVLALLFKALISMYKQCPKGILAYIIMSAAFVLSAFFKVNALIIILLCAAVGIVNTLFADRRLQ